MKRKTQTQSLSRRDAADLLNAIAKMVSLGDYEPGYNDVADLFRMRKLMLPKQCNGDAHSNPYIDNCSVCMPNWGYVYDSIKVK